MVSFVKEGNRINIYLTKATVAISIQGYPQVFIKRVDMKYLGKIFDNFKKA
jgi:hypothetical protein